MTCRLLCLLVLLLPLPLLAIDTEWTQYGGPTGNFTSHEKKLLNSWPDSGPKELWRQKVGAGFASPIAVDGKIYCFASLDDKDALTCIDADEGRLFWTEFSESTYPGSMPGPRATPTVDDEYIYTFGGKGDLICRDLIDGRERWTLDILSETSAALPSWGCCSSPTLFSNLLLLQTGDNGPLVVAINRDTHKIAWQSEETGTCSYSRVLPTTINNQTQLLTYTRNGLFALDPNTGKTLWKIPPKKSYSSGVAPIYSNGHLLLSGSYGEGSAMFTVDGKSDSSPECLWEKKSPSNYIVTPLLEGDCLYAPDGNALYCLHWPDGKELWKTDLPLASGGQYVRYDDKMILLSRSGELILAQVTPQKCTLISKFKLFQDEKNEILASPLVYRGRLYIKGTQDLVCLDITSK
ncbi:MAG: PQQ-binding-like beta-propeller repeat protein [Phycisphaerales bacterium]|nr:PQQ-binding-like beta-propeller repeat protein [Phycisphaerales bacterium]